MSVSRSGYRSLRPATQVFLSFDYERDIWRVQQVGNSWITRFNRAAAGFFDTSLAEASKSAGRRSVEAVVPARLEKHELRPSGSRGNALVGVRIPSAEGPSRSK